LREQSSVQPSGSERVNFLELVTKINGTRNWKVYGPDLDGRYGGLNGAGGLEAVYNQSTSTPTYVLSDTYGHGEGVLNGTTFTWNSSQSEAINGNEPQLKLLSNEEKYSLKKEGHSQKSRRLMI